MLGVPYPCIARGGVFVWIRLHLAAIRAVESQQSTILRTMGNQGAMTRTAYRYGLVALLATAKALSSQLSSDVRHSGRQTIGAVLTSDKSQHRSWNALMDKCIGKKLLVIAVSLLTLETVVVARRRGSLFELDTVVQCRHGHRFTTWWIPGVSFKALRLLWWRLQYCPVGEHYSIVTPVAITAIADDELRQAQDRHDIRIP